MKFRLYFSLLLFFLVFACGPDDDDNDFCEDFTNPNCPNFDPCYDSVPANSEFDFVREITASMADTVVDVPTDTIMSSSLVIKAREQSLENYTWTVGSDPNSIFGSRFVMNFTGFTGTIPVTLRTLADTTDTCLELDELSSSTTRPLVIIESAIQRTIFGFFRGYLLEDSERTEYTVEINYDNPPRSRLRGLPLNIDCDLSDRQDVGVPLIIGYRLFASTFVQVNPGLQCNDLVVLGQMTPGSGDEIKIEYRYRDDDGKWVERTFIGQRE